MLLPLSFWDLSLWTAIVAIILLVTSELLSPYFGRTGIVLNRKRLRAVAIVVALIFLSTMAYRVYEIIIKTGTADLEAGSLLPLRRRLLGGVPVADEGILVKNHSTIGFMVMGVLSTILAPAFENILHFAVGQAVPSLFKSPRGAHTDTRRLHDEA